MKTQSSAQTWTLDFDLGFVKMCLFCNFPDNFVKKQAVAELGHRQVPSCQIWLKFLVSFIGPIFPLEKKVLYSRLWCSAEQTFAVY